MNDLSKYKLSYNDYKIDISVINKLCLDIDGDNKITEAINLENASYVFCNYLKDGGCKKVINLKKQENPEKLFLIYTVEIIFYKVYL